MNTIFVSTVRGFANSVPMRSAIRYHLYKKLEVFRQDGLLDLLPSPREATQTFLSSYLDKAYVELVYMQGVGQLWPPPLVSIAFRLCGRSSWFQEELTFFAANS